MDHPPRPSAKVVGDEFAKEYYTVLQDYPQHLRGVYQDFSKIGRTRDNGMMCLHTLLDIDDENLNGGFGSAEVTSIVSRYCQGGVVLVVFGGYSTLKETLEMRKSFTQVFFLAPQEPEGYFILIDLLHFDDQTVVSASNVIEEKVPETEVTSKEVEDVPEKEVTRKEVAEKEVPRKEVAETEVPLKEVAKVPETEVPRKEVSEVPETEVTRKEYAEVPETEVPRKEVAEAPVKEVTRKDGLEDVSKISDASADVKDVKVIQQGQHPSRDHNEDTGNGNNQESQVLIEGSTVHVGNLPPNDTTAKVENAFKKFGPIKQIRVQYPGVDYYYAFVDFKEANAAKRAIEASPVMIDGRKVPVGKARGQHPYSDPSPEIKAGTGNGNNHEDQAVTEDAGICVKNLPPYATIALVQKEFEQFGAIRRDGIGVINRWGFSYGFIEFEEEKAARMAIEASPMIVLGRRFYVEKKLLAYRSYWKSPSSGQGKIHIRQKMRGTGVYHIRKDWQKSKEEQSKRQDEEGGTGDDHSRNYEQVMEEHRMIQGEQRKLQEEKMKLQEEIMKLQVEKTKFQEEQMMLQEEKTKLQEEKMKLQEERMKHHEEKIQEETMKLQEEKTKFQEEKTKFQEEKMKLQEEQRKLKEEEENQN